VIGVSIGIALAPADATDSVELLKAADLALLRAKMDGRGTYRFFDAALDGRIQTRESVPTKEVAPLDVPGARIQAVA
jgi:predicted signal transduction protein with EAL and GGDEF domain